MPDRVLLWLAWSIPALVLGLTVSAIALNGPATAAEVVWAAVPIAFAVTGALIVTYQRSNRIGWLLLVPAFGSSLSTLFQIQLAEPPVQVTFFAFAAIWFESWSWLTVIFPIFLFLQIFPTGRLVSRRWRWLVFLLFGMALWFLSLVTFSRTIGFADWSVENPIGFLGPEFLDQYFNLPWTVGLLVLVIGGSVSMIFRYRRANPGERNQMKLLFFALLFFVAVYSVAAAFGGESDSILLELAFQVSVVALPIAILVAIVRNRLFDIDLIIRRTLLYALLTGILIAVYLGTIIGLQAIFRQGQTAPWQVATSTLLATVLFNPLRKRIQEVIDRRLYRSRYTAQVVIETFSDQARNQADLEQLSSGLVEVVNQTIKPTVAGLWIRQ